MNAINERRSLFLQELGLAPQWQRKHMPAAEPAEAEATITDACAEAAPDAIPAAQADQIQPPIHAPIHAPAPALAPVETAVASMSWTQLQQAVASCTACALCQRRGQTVLGTGVSDPVWLVVGDAPSASDEAEGIAFSGKVGVLLDNMLRSVDKSRSTNVYLTNLVKCRAQDEQGVARPPSAEEIAACRPFL